MAVLIEHSETGFGRIALRAQRRSSLAEFGAPGVRRSLRHFGAGDLIAHACELRLEPDALLVAPLRLGLRTLVLAFELPRSRRARAQFRRQSASRFQIGVRALDLRSQRVDFSSQSDRLRFDSGLALASGIPRPDCTLRTQMRGAQSALYFFELRSHFDQCFAQARRLESTRENRALAGKASSGDCASARNLLAAERHDRIPQAAPANELDSDLQRRDDQNVPDEKVHDAGEARRRAHERVRVAQYPRQSGELLVEPASLAVRERVERQERRPAGLLTIEKLDASFGVFRRRRDDVGEPRAECHVHCARVSFVGGDEIGNDALDAAKFAALPCLDDRARTGNVALERVLQLLDGVKARFGRPDFDRLVAVRCERARDFLLFERRLALGILGAAARIENSSSPISSRRRRSPSLCNAPPAAISICSARSRAARSSISRRSASARKL